MDISVAIEITLISLQMGSSMIRNRTPDHYFGFSDTISFNKTLRKTALIDITSNMNAAIIVP